MKRIGSEGRDFRWRSRLGLAVALFLIYGALNALAAVYVPVSLHLGGPDAVGGLVLTDHADSIVLGRTLAAVGREDPRLAAFLVAFMDSMCAFMLAFAVLHLGVAWFALRPGKAWALWLIAAGDLAIVPHYLVIILLYARFGVPFAESFVGLIAVGVIVPVATLLGWLGLRDVLGPTRPSPTPA